MKTIRFDVWDLRADRREAVTEWVRSLGIEPKDCAARAAIVAAESGWELHLSRYVRNDEGKIRVDRAREEAVTEPVIVPIGTERNWPELGIGPRPVTVRLNPPDSETMRHIAEAVRKVIRDERGRSS